MGRLAAWWWLCDALRMLISLCWSRALPVITNHSMEWRVGGQGLGQSVDRWWQSGDGCVALHVAAGGGEG